eukprot:scaffold169344_cov43-Prasinocladus_malaysianus.AAC.1
MHTPEHRRLSLRLPPVPLARPQHPFPAVPPSPDPDCCLCPCVWSQAGADWPAEKAGRTAPPAAISHAGP